MFEFNASYIDGQNSAVKRIPVHLDSTGIVNIDGTPHQIKDAEISARLGNTPRKISFPNGAVLETSDNKIVDSILDHFDINKSQNISFRLENNLKLAIFASIFLLVGIAAFYRWGLPATSNLITKFVPTSVDDTLGEQVLPQLDDRLLKQSKISTEEQERIQQDFARLLEIRDLKPRNYQLKFRDAPLIGANAFALPDATIVVTDDIVKLLDDDELNSVLLHEIGHVQHRHSMRMLVRQTLLSSIILLMTGDPGFASSMILFVPQILLETQHSRSLETQSDTYALAHMAEFGIQPKAFASAMRKIATTAKVVESEKRDDKTTDKDKKDDEKTVLDYISTHPAPKDRIQRFLDAQIVFEAKQNN